MKQANHYSIPVADRVLAALLLLVAAPVLLGRALRQFFGGRQSFESKTFHSGLYSTMALNVYREERARKAPLLLAVVQGKLALVGPRLISVEEHPEVVDMPFVEAHFAAAPGVFSLFELRRQTALDFLREEECDVEFLENRSFKNRLNIVVRSLLNGALYGNAEQSKDVEKFSVLGVRIDNWSMKQSLELISQTVQQKQRKTVFFANAHTLNLSYDNADFRNLLNSVDVLLPDGSGIEVACRRQGIRRKGNVNGTDMLPLLCSQLADAGQSVFLLGGEEGIASSAAANLKKVTPELAVAGTRNGFFNHHNCQDVIDQINAARPDVLLVGMGQPLQEQWVAEHRDLLDVPVVIAVGGLFDFFAEKVSRAPVWLRELGMEWVWRLKEEPSRMWKRYIIGNPLFLLRIRRSAG